jgi:hypothetical protein
MLFSQLFIYLTPIRAQASKSGSAALFFTNMHQREKTMSKKNSAGRDALFEMRMNTSSRNGV